MYIKGQHFYPLAKRNFFTKRQDDILGEGTMRKLHVLLAMGLINIALGHVIKPKIEAGVDVGRMTIENLIVEIKGFEGVNISKTVLNIETKRYIAKHTVIDLLYDVTMKRINATNVSTECEINKKKEITGYMNNLLLQTAHNFFINFTDDKINKYVLGSTIKNLIVDEIHNDVGKNASYEIIASKVQSYVANKTIPYLMGDAAANYLKNNYEIEVDDDDDDNDDDTTDVDE